MTRQFPEWAFDHLDAEEVFEARAQSLCRGLEARFERARMAPLDLPPELRTVIASLRTNLDRFEADAFALGGWRNVRMDRSGRDGDGPKILLTASIERGDFVVSWRPDTEEDRVIGFSDKWVCTRRMNDLVRVEGVGFMLNRPLAVDATTFSPVIAGIVRGYVLAMLAAAFRDTRDALECNFDVSVIDEPRLILADDETKAVVGLAIGAAATAPIADQETAFTSAL